MTGRALVLGHRGARAVAPENTRAGILRALSDGADGVEFDVRQTADDRAVLLHDPTLDRTTSAGGPLASRAAADLAAVDAAARFPGATREPLPFLQDVLDEFLGRTLLAVEMKEVLRAPALAVLAAARATRPRAECVVASFQADAVAVARRALPDIPRALILEPGSAVPAPPLVAELGLCGVFAHHDDVDAAWAARARTNGLTLWVYTVNDAEEAAALVGLGVTGIITDDPARIRSRLPRS